jgi:hypothetical protein
MVNIVKKLVIALKVAILTKSKIKMTKFQPEDTSFVRA